MSAGQAVAGEHPAPRRSRLGESKWVPAALVALIVAAGALLAARWALSTDTWRVMTDELGYLKIAQSMGDTLSPAPVVRDHSISNYGVLYPALLAPLVGVFDVPTAFRLAHGLGALLMASTAIPAYLLGTWVSRSRAVGLAAAAPVALVPWLLLSMNLLTEVAAYPAFVWAVYASVVAVAEPSKRRDVFVLMAFVVVFFTRTQFIFLFGLLPVTVVLHEVGIRLAGRSPIGWVRQAGGGLRASVTSHPVLAAATLLGVLMLLLASNLLPLGAYGVVRSSKLFPPGFGQAAYDHINEILFGVGVLPLVLALAYVAEAVIRPHDRRVHALALHVVLIVPALVAIVTSFDLDFAGGVHERYLFYVAPLLLIAAACYMRTARRPVAALGAGTIVAALILRKTSFQPGADFPVYASPTRVSWVALDVRAGQFAGLVGIDDPANGWVLALGTAVVAVMLAVLLRSGRRRLALAGWGVGIALWCAALTIYCAPKVQAEHESLARQGLEPDPRVQGSDWIDRALPTGATAALVPSVVNSREGAVIPLGTVSNQAVWWQAEFWNKAVRRSYLYEGAIDYTPYVRQTMKLERRTGRLDVPEGGARYLVVAKSNVRLAPEGRLLASSTDLELIEAAPPYRAAWATRGVADNGAIQGRTVRLTVYGQQRSGRRVSGVGLVLAGPRAELSVHGEGIDRKVRVNGRRLISTQVCVPAGGSRTVELQGKIRGVRLVNVAVKRGPGC